MSTFSFFNVERSSESSSSFSVVIIFSFRFNRHYYAHNSSCNFTIILYPTLLQVCSC